jgi:hypothetical protein
MGDIATTTARNVDFGQELRTAFEHRHFNIESDLGAGDGGKKPRCATTDHNDPLRTHWQSIAKFLRAGETFSRIRTGNFPNAIDGDKCRSTRSSLPFSGPSKNSFLCRRRGNESQISWISSV